MKHHFVLDKIFNYSNTRGMNPVMQQFVVDKHAAAAVNRRATAAGGGALS
jgi:hypothetical protein